MNNINLSNQQLLEDAVKFVNIRLHGWIASRVYVDGKIIYSRLNKDSIPIIGVKVFEKIELDIYDKRLEFSLINNTLIPMLPLHALCDAIG
jgi:hypothetical protein